MPKNKQLPDVLLSKLHGKGTMSEILDIERTQLLKQSEQDMQRQSEGHRYTRWRNTDFRCQIGSKLGE